ncbi:hypothetical protein DBP21_22840 [Streptomyces sp. CS147]|nr:hypothetical protein DBP21_22840 [Streptomyces sp. CS147]
MRAIARRRNGLVAELLVRFGNAASVRARRRSAGGSLTPGPEAAGLTTFRRCREAVGSGRRNRGIARPSPVRRENGRPRSVKERPVGGGAGPPIRKGHENVSGISLIVLPSGATGWLACSVR